MKTSEIFTVVTNGLKPSNIKGWLWSAKVLTTIVWILFPLGYYTVIRILDVPSINYVVLGEGTLLDITLGPLIFRLPSEVAKVLGTGLIYIPPIPYMAFLFLFSVKENIIDIPYDVITSVKLDKGLLSSTIRFEAPVLVGSKRLGMIDGIVGGENDHEE
jgi:hypothetical protein